MDEDFKLFMRELLLRFDRLSRDINRGFDGMDARLQIHEEEFREIREENRAQRESLFRILDRLGNGGAPA